MGENQKKRLFVDIDGTLAVFKPVDTLETLYEEGYFLNLPPHENVIDAVKNIMKDNSDIEVFIMSSVLTDSKYALAEKNAWIDKYLPEIDKAHRVFPPCGEDKKAYIPDGVRETDFLLDDYTHNLTLWQPPARGIKLLNGINHTKETWQYDRLDYNKTGEMLAENIVSIIQNGEIIKDKSPLNYDGLDREEWQEFLEDDNFRVKHRRNLLKAVKKYLAQGYEKEQVKYLAGCEARYIDVDSLEINNEMPLEELKKVIQESAGVISFGELKDEDYVILDTEATGFGKDDEVIELGIIDKHGNRLYDGLLKPLDGHINSEEAMAVNQISERDLQEAPSIEAEWERIKEAIGNRPIVTYNLAFDRRMMIQTAQMHGIAEEESKSIWNNAKCIMQSYAEYKESYKAITLQNAIRDYGIDYEQVHRATDDCLVTKQLIDAVVKLEEQKNMRNRTTERIEQLLNEQPKVENQRFGVFQLSEGVESLQAQRFQSNALSGDDFELVHFGSDFEWGDSKEAMLESLFSKFNTGLQPSNYYGYSLSVGDVVVLSQNGSDFEAWRCGSFGWKRDDSFITDKVINRMERGLDIRKEREFLGNYVPSEKEDGSTLERFSYLADEYDGIFAMADARANNMQKESEISIVSQKERVGLDEYRHQVKAIYDYEVANNVPENDRMTKWYDEMGIAVAKPWYKENDPSVMDRAEGDRRIPISEMSISERYAEIKRELERPSKEQEEYFKNSVVRDENGNLLKMYHGTPFADFDYFKGGTHFTQNMEYAKNYESVGASSSGINNRKLMNGATLQPATYEVYLNITNPFTLENEECRAIFINEYIKGGNAVGINPYLDEEEYEKMFAENPLIDWNEADSLKEFLEEKGYDYDGLIVDEGGMGGYGEEVVDRGKAYVTFHPEQVKLTLDREPSNVKEFKKVAEQNKEKQKDSERYRYYVTQRPIDIGTIPNAQNAHTTNFADRTMVDEIGRQAYGYVEYDTPLTEQEIRNYELYTAPKAEVVLDNEILMDAGVRPLKDDECYVYVVRRASNGQYHAGWTQKLPEQLNQLKDKDKVLGCFIVPNKMTAGHFKNAIKKMSHFNVDTMLLYPDRLEDLYAGYRSVEYVNVEHLNALANLDVTPVMRTFQFMRSENDLANEIYNDSVTKLADAIQKSYLDGVATTSDTLLEMADNVLAERIPVIEMAVENGFSMKDIQKLMMIDVRSNDYLAYSMEQAQDIVTNGAETVIEDNEKKLIPVGAFEDVEVSENDNVKYYKSGLRGRYFMQVTDSNHESTLYSLENFSGLSYVSQFVLGGYEDARTVEAIETFLSLDEQVEDNALADNIVTFARDAGGQTVDKEQVITMLRQADSTGLYKLIENVDLINNVKDSGIDSAIKINQLKSLIKHNAKDFNRKNLNEFILSAQKDIRLLENIPDYMQNNISSLRQITKEVKGSLRYLPELAKQDLQCVLNAVAQDGQDFVYADAELRTNEEVIKTALKNDRSVVSYIDKEDLEGLISKSKMSLQSVQDMSIEDCVAIYSYTEDDISSNAINKLFEVNERDSMYKCLEAKWDGEEAVIVKPPKTAILKLKATKENEEIMGYSLEELKEKGIKPDISNYEIVYIKDDYVQSKDGISNLFRIVNGEEKPKTFYENAMEVGDIVVTTNDGFNFETYFVDMNNEKLDADFLNLLTVRRINDNIDVRVERDILRRFEAEKLLDDEHSKRLSMLDNLYSEHILNASERAGVVQEETSFELTQEEKDGLRKTDIAETRQNILPKDRMTFKKEDGEVILKKDAVKSKDEFLERTDELNRKEEAVRNISLTYAIESSVDFPDMLQEYPLEEIKNGTNYRLVQIDKLSGNIVKANEMLFSSYNVAEEYFKKAINNPNLGKANNVLVSYDVLTQKASEVAKSRKDNELLKGIQNVMDSESFKGWCIARANQFHNKYSLNNSLSIYLQKPDTSIVFGARQWQEYGRQVKKGEKALRITMPYKTAYQKEKGGLMKVIEKNIREQIESGKEVGTYRLGESNLTFVGGKNGLYSLLINDSVVLSNVDSKFLSNYIDSNIIGRTPVAYTTGMVFDISQVEEPEFLYIRNLKEEDKKDLVMGENGKPMQTRSGAYKVRNTPERRAKLNPVLDTHIEEAKELNVDEIYKSLQIISERDGIPVNESNVMEATGAKGYYTRKENKIELDSSLPPTEKVAVCVHEMAHSRMHQNGANMPRRLKEVQAETVAYIVNKSLGIDTETSSFNYIANWMGSRKMSEIKQSLDLINDEATKLYKDITKDLEERGVSLKLDEYKKEKALETEIFDKSAWEIELSKLFSDCIELNASLHEKRISISAQMEKEMQKDIVAVQMDILSACDSAINENAEISRMIELARAEISEKNPDGKKLQQYKQQISKAFERVQSAELEISKCEERISDIQKSNVAKEYEGMSEIDILRTKFKENSLDALNALKADYTKLADLEDVEIQFLSVSPFVEDAIDEIGDIKSFVDACSLHAENARKVKSEDGIFVEIVYSEYEGLKDGSMMHFKTADKMISLIEKGQREEIKEGMRCKALVPCVRVIANVYGRNKNNDLIALTGMKLSLGNGKQEGLMSAIENRAGTYSKYQGFTKDCREACKERHVERDKQTQFVPNIPYIIAHNNSLRERKEDKELHRKEALIEVENHIVKDLNVSSEKQKTNEQEKENRSTGDEAR